MFFISSLITFFISLTRSPFNSDNIFFTQLRIQSVKRSTFPFFPCPHNVLTVRSLCVYALSVPLRSRLAFTKRSSCAHFALKKVFTLRSPFVNRSFSVHLSLSPFSFGAPKWKGRSFVSPKWEKNACVKVERNLYHTSETSFKQKSVQFKVHIL